ncbi:hypothetical protein [Streptomyces minutiscleroticus]|uniref:hypothetical protein n=1 Tax=Streptomyces minutiscleroticus TaxID=68238 RepID=UPI00167D735C|nr:hypothetical protein [Streptomyces minutiscleroticus]
MNGDWLIRGRDGRLSAYAPRDEAAWCWAERLPGGDWLPPRVVGGSQRLHPVLAVGRGADGYAHLVSWRPTVPGESGLVHSTHFRGHLAALDWIPIGHPNKKGDRTGVPAVTVDAEGRAHVFVRNKGGGVSMLGQKQHGGWGPWRDLKGKEVHEELAAVTGESGRVEAYAATPDRILHWRQEEPGSVPVADEPLAVSARPGTLTALPTSEEHTTLFFTSQDGTLHAWRPGTAPVPLAAAAGPGPVAATRCVIEGTDCTLLAQRAASGRVAFAAYPTEQEPAGVWWTESGPQLPADAGVSLVVDREERVVAATLTPSTGQLLLTRRKDEPGLAFTAWEPVG